jgi:N-acetylglucosamine kinase-like BadF-type ATPase
MIVIADSGSTKCDWRILRIEDASLVEAFSTMGFNPYHHHESVISNTMQQQYQLIQHAAEIKYVFFYSAGCGPKKYRIPVERALQSVFKHAKIYVDHDLTAAAFATYEDDLSITCILGTGSNSCSFDGDIVREQVPALDYILGDEGSGAYFGKYLLSRYLYEMIPQHLSKKLYSKYMLTKEEIFKNVYSQTHANVYLASFMPFIIEHKTDTWIQEMISKGIDEFLEIHVCGFPEYKEVKTHFVGSIAHYFCDIITELSEKKGVQMGKIMKYPIEGLVDYHIKYYYPKISKLE